MSYKFSMSQCRFAFLLMCSMLLGLRGAVAQSGPEFLQQRGVPDTVHSEVLNEDRLIYVDFPLSIRRAVRRSTRWHFCWTAMCCCRRQVRCRIITVADLLLI